MKDIIISGATYVGVEQVHFQKSGGGTATFVDADTKGVHEMTASISNMPGIAFLFEASIPSSILTPSITLEV